MTGFTVFGLPGHRGTLYRKKPVQLSLEGGVSANLTGNLLLFPCEFFLTLRQFSLTTPATAAGVTGEVVLREL